jgi:uncharacterized protein (UPF0333 family)
MNKKTVIVIVGLLVFAVLLAAVIPAYAGSANKKLVRLKLINKSDQPVYLQLNGAQFYYLTVNPKTTKTFTVKQGVYSRTTWACGASAIGTLNMSSQVKLNFIPCDRFAPNQGEPTMEKVSLFDSPTGVNMRYQDETLIYPNGVTVAR